MSVNVARVRANPDPKGEKALTGIDKAATDEAVERRMKGDVSAKAWAAPARETSGRSFIAASSEWVVVDVEALSCLGVVSIWHLL